MRSNLRILVLAVLLGTSCLWSAELEKFEGVRYVADQSNDGDSFLVEMGENEKTKRYRVRLYFVDCPETTVGSKADASRVREQTRYFGLESAVETVKFGVEAGKFTQMALSEPFTMHTSFASALGRSAGGRIYAFITRSTGGDLARLLVASGYARAIGVGRQTPEGVSRDEMKEYLRDLEVAAAIKRVGVWVKTDPDRLVKLRQKQRLEDKALEVLKREVEAAAALRGGVKNVSRVRIDINKASRKELQIIHGIGPVMAQRIIDGRPYGTIVDLLKVKGIGSRTLKKLRAYVVVGKK